MRVLFSVTVGCSTLIPCPVDCDNILPLKSQSMCPSNFSMFILRLCVLDYFRNRIREIGNLRISVMSCHVMSCHVMSCHVMSCHAMSCHAMSCHVMSCHAMSCHVMSCHVMPCHVMSCHVMWEL